MFSEILCFHIVNSMDCLLAKDTRSEISRLRTHYGMSESFALYRDTLVIDMRICLQRAKTGEEAGCSIYNNAGIE